MEKIYHKTRNYTFKREGEMSNDIELVVSDRLVQKPNANKQRYSRRSRNGQ